MPDKVNPEKVFDSGFPPPPDGGHLANRAGLDGKSLTEAGQKLEEERGAVGPSATPEELPEG